MQRGKKESAVIWRAIYKSWLGQLSHHVNKTQKLNREKQNQKNDEPKSPEMVLKSVRSVWNGDEDYGGKNLW